VMGLTHPPFSWDLRKDERHIAEILGAAGYETHLFGFQHVSPADSRPGFRYLHGLDHARPAGQRGWAHGVATAGTELVTGQRSATSWQLWKQVVWRITPWSSSPPTTASPCLERSAPSTMPAWRLPHCCAGRPAASRVGESFRS